MLNQRGLFYSHEQEVNEEVDEDDDETDENEQHNVCRKYKLTLITKNLVLNFLIFKLNKSK